MNCNNYCIRFLFHHDPRPPKSCSTSIAFSNLAVHSHQTRDHVNKRGHIQSRTGCGMDETTLPIHQRFNRSTMRTVCLRHMSSKHVTVFNTCVLLQRYLAWISTGLRRPQWHLFLGTHATQGPDPGHGIAMSVRVQSKGFHGCPVAPLPLLPLRERPIATQHTKRIQHQRTKPTWYRGGCRCSRHPSRIGTVRQSKIGNVPCKQRRRH